MQFLKLTILTACLLPIAAVAQTVEDTDGDGVFSREEIAAAFPDVSEDTFAQMDANADGMIDEEELAAAVAAGIVAG